MIITAETLFDTIHAELVLACADLAQAKRDRLDKDTPAVRLRVQGCRKRIDAALDMWNTCRGSS